MRLPALLNRPAPPRTRQPGPAPVALPPHPPSSPSGRWERLLRWLDTHRKLVAVVAAVLLFVGIGAGAGGDAGWLRRGAPADSSADPAGGTAAAGRADADKAYSGRSTSGQDNAGKRPAGPGTADSPARGAPDSGDNGAADQASRGAAEEQAGRGTAGSAPAGSAADSGLAGKSAADQAAARRAAEDRAAAQKLAAAQAADDRAAAERAARAAGTTQPIAMPDLVGRKLNEAVSAAADAGLTGVTLCRTANGDTPLWWSNWRVTAQTVPTGTRIRPDREVCLTAAKP